MVIECSIASPIPQIRRISHLENALMLDIYVWACVIYIGKDRWLQLILDLTQSEGHIVITAIIRSTIR